MGRGFFFLGEHELDANEDNSEASRRRDTFSDCNLERRISNNFVLAAGWESDTLESVSSSLISFDYYRRTCEFESGDFSGFSKCEESKIFV